MIEGAFILAVEVSYNRLPMLKFIHPQDPLTEEEWAILNRVVKTVGNSNVVRKLIDTTSDMGAGFQTVLTESLVGITEGEVSILGQNGMPVETGERSSGIVPIIFHDFVTHWRDLAECRLTRQSFPISKAAAAASSCARAEDKFVLFGHTPLGYQGLMTIEGRNILQGLGWGNPGDAFSNFTRITSLLMEKGYQGPFAAVVHPQIHADMHRVIKGSTLLEISHVRSLLTGGIYRSSLLAPRSGFVVSTGRQNLELFVAVDTSIAFLGARKMNLPFRVFKAVYLRILRRDAICTF